MELCYIIFQSSLCPEEGDLCKYYTHLIAYSIYIKIVTAGRNTRSLVKAVGGGVASRELLLCNICTWWMCSVSGFAIHLGQDYFILSPTVIVQMKSYTSSGSSIWFRKLKSDEKSKGWTYDKKMCMSILISGRKWQLCIGIWIYNHYKAGRLLCPWFKK